MVAPQLGIMRDVSGKLGINCLELSEFEMDLLLLLLRNSVWVFGGRLVFMNSIKVLVDFFIW